METLKCKMNLNLVLMIKWSYLIIWKNDDIGKICRITGCYSVTSTNWSSKNLYHSILDSLRNSKAKYIHSWYILYDGWHWCKSVNNTHEKVCIWRKDCSRPPRSLNIPMHVSLCSCRSVRQVKDFDGFSRHMVLGEVRVPLRQLDMSYPLELQEPLRTPQKVTHTSLDFLHTLHLKKALSQMSRTTAGWRCRCLCVPRTR